jgi:hypothetical protein
VKPAQCGTHRLPPDGTPDREVMDRFAEFLRRSGPRVGPLTVAQAAFRREIRTDPEWRKFLGIEEKTDD